MKKIFFAILVLLILIFSAIQFIIPAKIRISGSNKIDLPALSIQRGLTNLDNWNAWFPGEKKSGTYQSGEIVVTPGKKLVSSVKIDAQIRDVLFAGSIGNITTNNEEKIIYSLEATEESTGPISRISQYFKARKVKRYMETALENLSAYLSDNKNIYGVPIRIGQVKDSTLISGKSISQGYPSNEEIYGLIDELQTYIRQQNGITRDSAMLNIFPLQGSQHQFMIAIPLLRDIPGNEKFTIKKMILGNLLQTQVTGGPYSIQKGEQALQNFMEDYQRESPAIPYQSLITDRRKITDTTKWITKIYYPVF